MLSEKRFCPSFVGRVVCLVARGIFLGRFLMASTFQESEVTTPRKIKMEPENYPLEDYFPLQTSGFQVPC